MKNVSFPPDYTRTRSNTPLDLHSIPLKYNYINERLNILKCATFLGPPVLAVLWNKNQYQDEDKADMESDKMYCKLNYLLLELIIFLLNLIQLMHIF